MGGENTVSIEIQKTTVEQHVFGQDLILSILLLTSIALEYHTRGHYRSR